MKKPSCILMDIEGTTSSISFVHDVLFPYAYRNIPDFLEKNRNAEKVRELIEAAVALAKQEGKPRADEQNISSILLEWVKKDKKHPAFKALQGMIWKKGYEDQEYFSHIYDDVPLCWEKWLGEGITLAIYSSGSVAAQKLLFKHTSKGDLRAGVSSYFDTGVGHKKSAESYRKIAGLLEIPSDEIIFLSDVTEELHAAREAGLQTVHILRAGTKDENYIPSAKSFSEIRWS